MDLSLSFKRSRKESVTCELHYNLNRNGDNNSTLGSRASTPPIPHNETKCMQQRSPANMFIGM